MRLSLLALFGLLCLAYAMAEEEVAADEPVNLLEVSNQGHANEGDRDVRHWGGHLGGWGRGGSWGRGGGWGHGGGWGYGGSWGGRGGWGHGGWGNRGGWGGHW
ncbi:neuropeptide-like protein 32 [Drosophila busckii]|uniref:neuropeptide-like protein 32 n=1 Tax=Drosophila busckii TaxID=30019 RepID=UPI00083F2448|nr:neuropeptide-like protein 32 [Drosophila busckii]